MVVAESSQCMSSLADFLGGIGKTQYDATELKLLICMLDSDYRSAHTISTKRTRFGIINNNTSNDNIRHNTRH